MVHLAYELHGVLLLACDINLDPGCSEFRPGGVVAGEVLALIGERVHLQESPGAVRAPVAAELDSVASGAGGDGSGGEALDPLDVFLDFVEAADRTGGPVAVR